MADDKLNTGPGEKKIPEAPEAVTAGQPQALAPEQAAAPTPQQEQAGPAKPDPGDAGLIRACQKRLALCTQLKVTVLRPGCCLQSNNRCIWQLPIPSLLPVSTPHR